eukprot:371880-Pyramimonas_sp.AAC.1
MREAPVDCDMGGRHRNNPSGWSSSAEGPQGLLLAPAGTGACGGPFQLPRRMRALLIREWRQSVFYWPMHEDLLRWARRCRTLDGPPDAVGARAMNRP